MIKAIDIRKPDSNVRLKGLTFGRIRTLIAHENKRTPFLILSRSLIGKNLDDLARSLPGVAIHYAVKSNNHPVILEEVAAAGHSFDVASSQELQQAVMAGGHAEKIIHSHPIKSPEEIAAAVDAGATIFVIDNADEIDKFMSYKGRVRLLIRLKVADSAAVVNLSYKFGCRPEEVPALAQRMHHLGLDFYGLTFHVGSQCVNNEVFVKAIDSAANIIKELDSQGFAVKLLDIGGGFPIPYTDAIPPIAEFCRPICKALKEKISPEIMIACEPGRYISGPAVTLIASIIGKSKRSGRDWYFLDDGLYGSFSGRLYDHCRYQVLTNRNTTWKHSVLAGPTCDSFDVIYKDIVLPPLQVGDMLMFPAMGAYCSVSASTFNGLRKAEYIVTD